MKQKQTQGNTARNAPNSNQILRVTQRELNPTDKNSVKAKWVWRIRFGAEKLHQEETGKFFSYESELLEKYKYRERDEVGWCRVADCLRLFLNKNKIKTK